VKFRALIYLCRSCRGRSRHLHFARHFDHLCMQQQQQQQQQQCTISSGDTWVPSGASIGAPPSSLLQTLPRVASNLLHRKVYALEGHRGAPLDALLRFDAWCRTLWSRPSSGRFVLRLFCLLDTQERTVASNKIFCGKRSCP